MSVLFFADREENPTLEAADRNAAGPAPAAMIFDPGSGLLHAAGPSFSSYGMMAAAQHRLLGNNQVRVTYANGNALVFGSGAGAAVGPAQLMAMAHAHHAQTYSISLSGTLEGSGTRWRATYRWQPESTITPVAAFAQNQPSPYLSFQFRQPIHLRRDGSGGLEALLNLRNLLAQGYQPILHERWFAAGFCADAASCDRRAGLQLLASTPIFARWIAASCKPSRTNVQKGSEALFALAAAPLGIGAGCAIVTSGSGYLPLLLAVLQQCLGTVLQPEWTRSSTGRAFGS